MTRTTRHPGRRRYSPILEGLECRLALSTLTDISVLPTAEIDPSTTTDNPSTATGGDNISIIVEAEDGVGDGRNMPRSHATGENHQTRLLGPGESLTMTIDVTVQGVYSVPIVYSRDNPDAGPAPVSLFLDDGLKGSFIPGNTRPAGGAPGSGWNNFDASPEINLGPLSIGTHEIRLEVDPNFDQWGIEFDHIELQGIAMPDPIVIQAESGTTDGMVMNRSEATGVGDNHQTLWLRYLGQSQTATYTVQVDQAGSYQLATRYARDDLGPAPLVQFALDGTVLEFRPENTRDSDGIAGSGWNHFTIADLGAVDLDAGQHTLTVTIGRDYAYWGVEFDSYTLTMTSFASATTTTQPIPSASLLDSSLTPVTIPTVLQPALITPVTTTVSSPNTLQSTTGTTSYTVYRYVTIYYV